MIIYAKSLWGLHLLGRVYGSALPRVLVPAALSGALVVAYGAVIPHIASLWAHPYAYTPFVMLISFLLAFRSNYAYTRHWEAYTSYSRMGGWLADAALQFIKFDRHAPGGGSGSGSGACNNNSKAAAAAGAAAALGGPHAAAAAGHHAFAAELVHLTSLMHAVACQALRRDPVLANLRAHNRHDEAPPLDAAELSSFAAVLSNTGSGSNANANAGNGGAAGPAAAEAAAAAGSTDGEGSGGGGGNNHKDADHHHRHHHRHHRHHHSHHQQQQHDAASAGLAPSPPAGIGVTRRVRGFMAVGTDIIGQANWRDLFMLRGSARVIARYNAAQPLPVIGGLSVAEMSALGCAAPAGADGGDDGPAAAAAAASAAVVSAAYQQQQHHHGHHHHAHHHHHHQQYGAAAAVPMPPEQPAYVPGAWPGRVPSVLGLASLAGGGDHGHHQHPPSHDGAAATSRWLSRLRSRGATFSRIASGRDAPASVLSGALADDDVEAGGGADHHHHHRNGGRDGSSGDLSALSGWGGHSKRAGRRGGVDRSASDASASATVPRSMSAAAAAAALLERAVLSQQRIRVSLNSSCCARHLPYMDRPLLVLAWLHDLLLERQVAGGLDIPAPVLAQAYRSLAEGVAAFHQLRKLADTPFPFPWAQFIVFMLVAFTATLPLMVLAYVSSTPLAVALTVISTAVYWAVNEVARDVEDPFLYDPNEMPMATSQYALNEAMLTLAGAERPPSCVLAAPAFFAAGRRPGSGGGAGVQAHTHAHAHPHPQGSGAMSDVASATPSALRAQLNDESLLRESAFARGASGGVGGGARASYTAGAAATAAVAASGVILEGSTTAASEGDEEEEEEEEAEAAAQAAAAAAAAMLLESASVCGGGGGNGLLPLRPSSR